jgi:ATP-dependent DNA ligase
MINKLPILYKRNINGSIQQWRIVVKQDSFYSEEGLVDGKLTSAVPTIVEGKNLGRANETSANEQALKEAEAKWKKKLEEGYFEDIKDIDNTRKIFKPMLAEKYLERQDEIIFPVLVSTKIDGHRMVARKDGLWTRNGKKYVSCPHIFNMLKPFFLVHPDWIIDGEIYSHDENFEKISSLVRKTKPTKEDLEESKRLVQYWIFDGVTSNKDLKFTERFELIKNEIKGALGVDNEAWKSFKFVENIEVLSPKTLEEYHNSFVAAGFEGLMVRLNTPYENRRSKNLLKYKKFNDMEFTITDVEEGKGNRSGMAGNLILQMYDGRTFCAGIKGSLDYYKKLLKNKNKLIGKKATIRYQNLTEDGMPRFPVAVDIDRWDVD